MQCNHRTSVLLILLVVLASYYPLIFAPYNSVDDIKMVTGLLNSDALDVSKLFLPGTGYYYRPILFVSFWFDKQLWGLEQSFMHLGNVFLHLANALLLYAFAFRIFALLGYVSSLAALSVSLLFALHPINVESVAWISGRTDVLAGTFLLLTLIFFLSALKHMNPLWALPAAALLILACLVKESALFALPGMIFMASAREIAEYRRKSDLQHPLFRHLAACFILFTGGLGYLVLRAIALAGGDSGIGHAVKNITGHEAGWSSLRVLLKVSGFYLKKLIIPWPLNFGIVQVSDFYVILGVLLVGLSGFLLVRRTLVCSQFIAGIFLGSSALLVPLGKMAWTPLAERYMYLPSMFFVTGMVALWLRMAFSRKHTVNVIVIAVVLAIFGWTSVARVYLWQDNSFLFRDTIKKSPQFVPARNELANALLIQGRREEAFGIIRNLEPPPGLQSWEIADINKAKVYLSEKRLVEAKRILRRIAERPGNYQREALMLLINVVDKELVDAQEGEQSQSAGKEMLNLISIYEKICATPFDNYRIGQLYLALKKNDLAKLHFEKAAVSAPIGTYYREPAIKLSKTLK